jgi:hypothetical protein
MLTLFGLGQWRHQPRGPTKYLLLQKEQREREKYEEVSFLFSSHPAL